jgi:hypothetical protein
MMAMMAMWKSHLLFRGDVNDGDYFADVRLPHDTPDTPGTDFGLPWADAEELPVVVPSQSTGGISHGPDEV